MSYSWCQYGSARGSYLRMLDPIQNHALRLCLGAYRTSPASSLCVEANEPPLYFRRKKLSLQYCLKLSCNYNNPAYATVFNSKFHSVFERKPTQLPPLAVRVSGDLQAVGFKKSDVITSSISTTPPWLLTFFIFLICFFCIIYTVTMANKLYHYMTNRVNDPKHSSQLNQCSSCQRTLLTEILSHSNEFSLLC